MSCCKVSAVRETGAEYPPNFARVHVLRQKLRPEIIKIIKWETFNIKRKNKIDDGQLEKIFHLSRLPVSAKDTLNPLCSQQDASIAAVWPASSRRFMFLTNLRRKGRRPWIPITHSVLSDVHSTASRSKWQIFIWTTSMQRDRSAYTTWIAPVSFAFGESCNATLPPKETGG